MTEDFESKREMFLEIVVVKFKEFLEILGNSLEILGNSLDILRNSFQI